MTVHIAAMTVVMNAQKVTVHQIIDLEGRESKTISGTTINGSKRKKMLTPPIAITRTKNPGPKKYPELKNRDGSGGLNVRLLVIPNAMAQRVIKVIKYLVSNWKRGASLAGVSVDDSMCQANDRLATSSRTVVAENMLVAAINVTINS